MQYERDNRIRQSKGYLIYTGPVAMKRISTQGISSKPWLRDSMMKNLKKHTKRQVCTFYRFIEIYKHKHSHLSTCRQKLWEKNHLLWGSKRNSVNCILSTYKGASPILLDWVLNCMKLNWCLMLNLEELQQVRSVGFMWMILMRSEKNRAKFCKKFQDFMKASNSLNNTYEKVINMLI